eukprot:TRINITY_DN277_c0_g1_i5.p1 TRINITY_DN277_c0_g1~~TRINITY_DN277_c0_g1_i5.p1  ORF type:complete len:179 (-),score=39.03 TRINITY_DN277_c0_g1_i5:413-949(-)
MGSFGRRPPPKCGRRRPTTTRSAARAAHSALAARTRRSSGRSSASPPRSSIGRRRRRPTRATPSAATSPSRWDEGLGVRNMEGASAVSAGLRLLEGDASPLGRLDEVMRALNASYSHHLDTFLPPSEVADMVKGPRRRGAHRRARVGGDGGGRDGRVAAHRVGRRGLWGEGRGGARRL